MGVKQPRCDSEYARVPQELSDSRSKFIGVDAPRGQKLAELGFRPLGDVHHCDSAGEPRFKTVAKEGRPATDCELAVEIAQQAAQRVKDAAPRKVAPLVDAIHEDKQCRARQPGKAPPPFEIPAPARLGGV